MHGWLSYAQAFFGATRRQQYLAKALYTNRSIISNIVSALAPSSRPMKPPISPEHNDKQLYETKKTVLPVLPV